MKYNLAYEAFVWFHVVLRQVDPTCIGSWKAVNPLIELASISVFGIFSVADGKLL